MSNALEDKPESFKHKGKDGGNEKKLKPPKKISARYLYNSGLAYLQRFPASSFHFRTVMMRKIDRSCRHHTDQLREDCIKLLDDVVAQFFELSLLDDNAYLKGMVISLRRRGLSAMQIQMRLQQKGYDRDTVKAAVQAHDADEFDTEENGDIFAALVFARKKRLGPYDPQQKRSPEKSLATMARAGYSYDIAKRTLEISEDELEERLSSL